MKIMVKFRRQPGRTSRLTDMHSVALLPTVTSMRFDPVCNERVPAAVRA